MIDNKSILLVGNGGSLKNSNFGSKIDEFDEVIRINEGKTIGWEKDAGTKFTIWSTYNPQKKFYKYFNGYINRGYSDEQIRDILKEVKEIWYVHPHQVVNYRYPQLNKYLQKGYKKRCGTQELINYVKSITPHATTGFILINMLNLLYDKFYIIGFDFMGLRGDMATHHYFTDSPIKTPGEGDAHKLEIEYNHVKELEFKNRLEYLERDTEIIKSKLICEEEKYLK